MSQRKSKNRRSSNVLGVLNENTNILENNDPLWANRTIVRPSMSFNLSKNASTVLSSGSDVNTSQLTDQWYRNLSHSETSKIIRSISEKKTYVDEGKQNVKEYSQMEIESGEEPRRKRRKLRTYVGKKKQRDTGLADSLFMEVFDNTDSPSKKLSQNQTAKEVDHELTDDNTKTQMKLRRRIFKASKKPAKDSTNQFDIVLDSSSSDNNQDNPGDLKLRSKSDTISSESSTENNFKQLTRFTLKRRSQNTKGHRFSPGTSKRFKEALNKDEDVDYSEDERIDKENSDKPLDSSENVISSNMSMKIRNNSNLLSKISEQEQNFKNDDSFTRRRSKMIQSWLETSFESENIQTDDNLKKTTENVDHKRGSLNSSALHDIQNKIENIKKPRVILQRVLLPGSENYIPINLNIGKSVKAKSAAIIDKIDESAPKTNNKNTPQKQSASHVSDSESLNYQSDLLQSPTPAQSTLMIQGKPLTDIRISVIPETSVAQKRQEKSRQQMDEDVDVDVVNSSSEELPALLRSEKNETITSTTDDEGVKAFFKEKPTLTRKQLASHQCTSTIDEEVWREIKKKTDALKIKIEARDKRVKEVQIQEERKKARIFAKLRRFQALQEAEKKKKLKKPIDKAYYVNGKLYKQPKLPRPKKWVTPKLYRYLWKAMEQKFGRETRIMSEKFVLKLSNIYTVIIRRKNYENYVSELNDLLIEMAKLKIIKTRYDFYRFCSEFMPPNFHNKVVPMMLPGNKRNIPYDLKSVYESILEKSSSDEQSEDNSEDRSGNDSDSESESKSKSKSKSKLKSESESESE